MAVITLPEPSEQTVMQVPASRRIALRRRWGRRIALSILIVAAVPFLIYVDVKVEGTPILADRQTVPACPVAIVFGAGYTRSGLSPILYDRVATAVELYKAGKARKLLMTGDNGQVTHNEPEAMRQTAIKLGVPRRDIVLDYAGFRTYDSLYRARDIFGVRQAILVTQSYHLPRALFTARALGIDVVGVPADRRDYGPVMPRYTAREVLALENAWLEARITHPRPARMGKKEPIFR